MVQTWYTYEDGRNDCEQDYTLWGFDFCNREIICLHENGWGKHPYTIGYMEMLASIIARQPT